MPVFVTRVVSAFLISCLVLVMGCDAADDNSPLPDSALPAVTVPSATPTPTATRIPYTTVDSTAVTQPQPTPAAESDGLVNVSPAPDTLGGTLTFDNRPEAPSLDILGLARQFLPNADLSPQTAWSDSVGDSRTFYIYELNTTTRRAIETRLCLSTEHADFYVQDNIRLTCAAFGQRIANRFELHIRPDVIARFAGNQSAAEDLRIAIVHAELSGFGGYFDSSDLYPLAVNPFASGRITLFLNAGVGMIGNPSHPQYDGLVVHELQHALHELSDSDEATWVNEGLSVVAEDVIIGHSRAHFFLNGCPPTQFIVWPSIGDASACNYAGAGLFMRYLLERYPDQYGTLRTLAAEPANGLRGIDAYLDTITARVSALDVFADWGVANYIDGLSPQDAYHDSDARASITSQLDATGRLSRSFTQFAADYVALPVEEGEYTVVFTGDQYAPLLSDFYETGGGFWHAGGDDSSAYTLTREFDLEDVEAGADATLTLFIRYDTEEDWDYAYATVSTDGGRTWEALRSPSMDDTSEIAVGSAFGPGFSGRGRNGARPLWILEELDLSRFAGQRILIRLLYLTDQAVSLDGVSLGGAWLPVVDYGWLAINHSIPVSLAAMGNTGGPDGGWSADGFFFSNSLVEQQYAVRLITITSGGETSVTPILIDGSGRGTLAYDNTDGSIAHATLMVMPFAPQTRQPAIAAVTVTPVDDD